jgi:hypothetical protein
MSGRFCSWRKYPEAHMLGRCEADLHMLARTEVCICQESNLGRSAIYQLSHPDSFQEVDKQNWKHLKLQMKFMNMFVSVCRASFVEVSRRDADSVRIKEVLSLCFLPPCASSNEACIFQRFTSVHFRTRCCGSTWTCRATAVLVSFAFRVTSWRLVH